MTILRWKKASGQFAADFVSLECEKVVDDVNIDTVMISTAFWHKQFLAAIV